MSSERVKDVWCIKTAGEEEFKTLMETVIKLSNPVVSEVQKVTHKTHVQMDAEKGYQGLPEDWAKMLESSGVVVDSSKMDMKQVSAVMSAHESMLEGKKVEPRGQAKELPQVRERKRERRRLCVLF